MTSFTMLVATLCLLALGVGWRRRRRRACLSDRWWRDFARAQGRVGVDQSWLRQWPINKLLNESGHRVGTENDDR